MKENLDYKKDVQIDEFNLDKEWITHSKLYMKWAEHQVICADKVDKLNLQSEVLYAELDKFIRNNSEKKPTETAIKNEIFLNKDYKKIQEEIIEANHNLRIAKAAVSAFEHRKKALERSCDLWMFGYNASPKQNIKDKILDNVQSKIKGGL